MYFAIKEENETREPSNKGKRLPPEPLTREEVETLLRGCSKRCPTGLRNRALIVMLWRGQLRAGEALALLPKDLDRERGTVRVLHGKGDKSRVVGLDPGSWEILERWIDERKQLGFNGSHRLFCTLRGKPIFNSYLRKLLPRLALKTGIQTIGEDGKRYGKRVHPHGLRHSGAFDLANEGHPIHVISAQLGHSSTAVTDRYISHLAPQAVIETMQGREWREPE